MNLSSEYTEDIRSLPGRSAHKRGELFMQKLSGRKLLLIGFTLFSMFFGAGNLIFPPDLGAKAGIHFWPAFLGLAISAVGLPVAGVVAVARAQGLEKLAGRVHPVFAQVFMILIYLSIGPCLAIPRTASTSFAMLAPLVGTGAGLQLGYSVVFFAAAFLVALRPERLTRWLGRLLCPCLLVLILVLFGGCLLHPLAGQYGAPTPEYTSGAVLQGVLYGYQTMDTLAALNFGAVIALNIQAQGITRQEEVQRSTILAGFVAGGLLLAVYAMLGHAGALTGAAVPGLATGADVLTVLADRLFGKAGLVLLAAIFVLACFNTCVGLIACVGEYFHTLVPSVPYPAFAGFFAAASMLLSNLGLADILRLSVPVLNALYPVAILLICLSFVPELEQRHPLVYPLCIGCTALQSVASALPLGPLSALAKVLPLGAVGFGWVLPAAVGLLAVSTLKNDYDAEDAMQSAILKAYENLDQLRAADKFKPWLFRILINECYRLLNDKTYNVDIDEFTDIGETQENLDDRITLWETVNRLDDEYRMVIILFYYEGMKIKDIAKTLEISEANVKKRLQRARGHLSQMLDREDFQ